MDQNKTVSKAINIACVVFGTLVFLVFSYNVVSPALISDPMLMLSKYDIAVTTYETVAMQNGIAIVGLLFIVYGLYRFLE